MLSLQVRTLVRSLGRSSLASFASNCAILEESRVLLRAILSSIDSETSSPSFHFPHFPRWPHLPFPSQWLGTPGKAGVAEITFRLKRMGRSASSTAYCNSWSVERETQSFSSSRNLILMELASGMLYSVFNVFSTSAKVGLFRKNLRNSLLCSTLKCRVCSVF